MSTSIAELAEILQKLLIEDGNRIGRETGFIQNARGNSVGRVLPRR
jgi:hypothetical protein